MEAGVKSQRKTHVVIDLVYHTEEHNVVYSGTFQECFDWKIEQGFGYQIVAMTPEELKIYNEQ